jgi:3-hydroxyisobutyrate dehydrogenase-like beta-hydroxyacid dehydrogenase
VLFRVADMLKDLGLAQDLYRRSGSSTPMTATADDLFRRAGADQGELDIPAVVEIFRGA